ncbi:MAG TPA: segregation and condensation protein A [Nitrospinae bacterium]|nr:segregation and condensation protein A [Nitrospinota bacterium]HBA27758.1 segregation and condensation protein A [Nitrospinota bacterium]
MTYQIKLPIFEGPLDLLLHLIREHEINIYDIPIAFITKQYLEYIELLKNLNLEVAGEFLVMASTLIHIKSRTLLPKSEVSADMEEEGDDPREELVRKLLEYKKYKEAAGLLRDKEIACKNVFTRKAESEIPDEGELLIEVSIFDLLSAFKNVIKNIKESDTYEISVDEVSVTERINYIMEALGNSSYILFESLFSDMTRKMELVATFLALLELIRLKLIKIQQTKRFGTIRIFKTVEETKNGHESSTVNN